MPRPQRPAAWPRTAGSDEGRARGGRSPENLADSNFVARSLLPKEHGAYAQLLIPSLTALACWPSIAGVAIAVAGVFGFLLHEPALVATGRRGAGVRARHGKRAFKRLVVLGLAASFAAGYAVIATPSSAWWALIVCGCAAGVVTVVAVAGWERSIVGEICGAAALSATAMAIAVAAGAPAQVAVACWSVWICGFGATVFSVRGVITQHKQPRTALRRLFGLGVWLVGTAAIAFATVGSRDLLSPRWGEAIRSLWFAPLPLAFGAALLLALPPHPRHLHRVGWVLAGASTVTAILLVLAIRG